MYFKNLFPSNLHSSTPSLGKSALYYPSEMELDLALEFLARALFENVEDVPTFSSLPQETRTPHPHDYDKIH